jgi:phosphoglycerol transferase MdoB-like AlkP superfamily enzyme
MPAFRLLPPLLRFVLLATAINFAVFAALRLVFWGVYADVSAHAAAADIATALHIGLRLDLRLALFVSLPLALLGWIPRLSPLRHRLARRVWTGYFALAATILLFLYFVDFGHYAYVRRRLNASLIDHLTPVDVALGMAWETYPVVWGVLALAALISGYVWLLKRLTRPLPGAAAPGVPVPALVRRAAVAALAVLYVFGMWGKGSWYPLRWSEAYFASSEAVAALALNPVLFLTDTMANRERPYDTQKVRAHYARVSELLGVQEPDAASLSFARYLAPRAPARARPNLVVIHLESFAAFKVGVFGNRSEATPRFDALARDGVLFTNFFVPAVPTARAVFTMMTGIPDVNPKRSASRNPLVINQHTLINALEGYEKLYFLGGSAAWGNIRGLLANNIPGLKMFEEGDFRAERADPWGISDLALFERAHGEFVRRPAPFFAFIQTSGNHRPFTIPEDRRGFESRDMDERSLKEHGFESLAAYNGLRFFDFALGHFFDLARREPYFRNTIFIMYGDHGNPSARDIPWERLGLTGYHVPMLIYAPGLIAKGRRIDRTASLPDLLPTLFGVAGVPHVNTSLGRDLLALGARDPRYSLIGEGGILDDEFYLQLNPGGAPRLYRYRSSTPLEDVSSRHVERAESLLRLREALLETSRYLLYHNPPRAHSAVTHAGQAGAGSVANR